MTIDTTRRHRTRVQEVDFLKKLKMLTNLWRWDTLRDRIHNLGWTQVEIYVEIIKANVEKSSCGYDLSIEKL